MESVQEHYQSMRAAIETFTPNVSMELVDEAFRYAEEKHKDQRRKDGSPYIIHPLAVAEIVAEMGLDSDAILASLLHDTIEDTDTSYDEVAKRFGVTVANLVEGVTKLTRVNFTSLEDEQMENLRKMFLAMSKDIRVILIKIADRLHNTRTMQYQTPAKQKSKSLETMEIYAPLAHRLSWRTPPSGIWTPSATRIFPGSWTKKKPNSTTPWSPSGNGLSSGSGTAASNFRCTAG